MAGQRIIATNRIPRVRIPNRGIATPPAVWNGTPSGGAALVAHINKTPTAAQSQAAGPFAGPWTVAPYSVDAVCQLMLWGAGGGCGNSSSVGGGGGGAAMVTFLLRRGVSFV